MGVEVVIVGAFILTLQCIPLHLGIQGCSISAPILITWGLRKLSSKRCFRVWHLLFTQIVGDDCQGITALFCELATHDVRRDRSS